MHREARGREARITHLGAFFPEFRSDDVKVQNAMHTIDQISDLRGTCKIATTRDK